MAVSFLYILRLMENYINYGFWQDCKRISRTPEFRGWFESAVSNVQLLLLPECEDLAFSCSLLVQAGPFRLRNLLKFIILIFSWRVFDLSSDGKEKFLLRRVISFLPCVSLCRPHASRLGTEDSFWSIFHQTKSSSNINLWSLRQKGNFPCSLDRNRMGKMHLLHKNRCFA